MSLGKVGSPVVPISWLSHGWNAIRELAHDALTHFEHDHEERVEEPTQSSQSSQSSQPSQPSQSSVPQTWGLIAADVVEHDNEVQVLLEVPGLAREDLQVEVQGNVVSVQGERRMSNSRRVGNTLITERAFGKFSRRIPLAVKVDSGASSAELNDGVLVITLPKHANDDSAKVEIK